MHINIAAVFKRSFVPGILVHPCATTGLLRVLSIFRNKDHCMLLSANHNIHGGGGGWRAFLQITSFTLAEIMRSQASPFIMCSSSSVWSIFFFHSYLSSRVPFIYLIKRH
jgi:hypothetical protein